MKHTILWTFCALLLACSRVSGNWFPVEFEAPAYPPLANQARIAGTVKLKLKLSPDGHVIGTEVFSGHPLLAPAARENILTWRFSQPCGSAPATIQFTYLFRLGDGPTDRFRYEQPFTAIITSHALQLETEQSASSSHQQP